MPGGKISKSDFLNESLLKAFDDLNIKIDQTVQNIKELAGVSQMLGKQMKSSSGIEQYKTANQQAATTVNKLTGETKQYNTLIQERTRIENQLHGQLAKNLAQTEKNYTVLQKGKIQNQERAKQIKDEIKLNRTQENSISRLIATNKRLIAERNKLNLTTKQGRTDISNLNKQIDKNNVAIRQNSDAYTRQKIGIGGYTQSIMRSVKALAAQYIGIMGVFRALRSVGKITKENDAATAQLAAITGKTRDEIADLTKQAELLGAVTPRTKAEVTGLQIELAKLGFVAQEIKNATPAILDFSIATGADLADAAKTAGVAVRAFGLSTLETESAVATLAVATTKSALTFSDYDTILSTVGPVAKAYNFTLEETVALTGKLRDAGFDASKAATATRNILLNLADANGDLAKELGGNVETFDGLIDGLIQLNRRGISLNETLELTDKRSVAAFNQFLNVADSARELKTQITGVNEQLGIMVDTQLDTLAGDIDLLRSAWEALAEVDTGPLRSMVQLLTNAVLQLGNLDLAVTKFHKQDAEQIARSFELLMNITNRQGEKFQSVIKSMEDVSLAQLLSDQDRYIEQIKEVRKVNEKEAKALFEEFIRRRTEAITNEMLARNELSVQQEKNINNANEEVEVNKGQIAYRDALNKAIAKTADLMSKIQAPDDLTAVARFDIPSGQYVTENFEAELLAMADSTDYLFEGMDEANKEYTEKFIEYSKERFKTEEELAIAQSQKLKEIEGEKFELKRDIISKGFDLFIALNNREIQAIDDKLERGLGNERQLQAEKTRLLRKAARLEKAKALFEIAVNTASAVAEALPNIPLSILIAGLGVASAAVVIAQPIPQYAKGVKRSGAGPAVVGEKGPELRIEPSGEMSLTPGESTLTYLKRGTEIKPADVTKKLLQYTTIANAMEGRASDAMIMAMMNEMKASNEKLRRELKNKPVASSTLTPAGILTAVHRGNTTIRKVDKYFK